LPVWLPVTSTPHGRATQVWGHARPAYFARVDTGQPQTVLIQWAPGSSGQFQTVAAVQTDALGYLDTQVKFPASGQVRLAWEYPSTDASLRDPLDPSLWIYSRVTNITVYRASGYFRGLFKGHTKVGLTVDQGANVPLIESVAVRPPSGLKFKCVPVKKKKQHEACNGLVVSGGKVKSASVSGGKFMLGLAWPLSKVSITAGAPFVYVTTGLRRKLERRARRVTVTFTLLVTDTSGASTTIPLKLRVK
jgi:hypothetical protein